MTTTSTLRSAELHILLACADARDLSQVQLDAANRTVRRWRELGVDVTIHSLRVAGSFVTPDVVLDIRRAINTYQRELPAEVRDVRYFVHIQTHGHLDDASNKAYISHLHEMNVVDNSPLNCGMMGATAVAIDIEQMLLEAQPEVETSTGTFRVRTDADIVRLLREVYAYDGYLAGDWITGIDRLRTHPRTQRSRLERAIRDDAELRRLGISITAGILDYSIHALIRLDGGDPPVPFWDEMQALVRELSVEMLDDLRAQSLKQTPLAGLICTSDPRRTSRVIAAEYYLTSRGIDVGEYYLPNTLFNISSGAFDLPAAPFGPYHIGGFFFAVRSLGLQDWMVMGYDAAQTARILQKIERDPIMQLIVERHGVNLIPINQIDLQSEVLDETHL